MTAALGMPEVRIGRGALIWLTATSAYKLFWGSGAGIRCEHELQCSRSARDCPVWGSHFLPVRRGRIPHLLYSVRGRQLPHTADQALQAFLEERLRVAAAQSPPLPAPRLIETAKLQAALGEKVAGPLIEALYAQLSSLMLPAGPVHGDLHRHNILKVDGQYFVIDCDRFNPLSSPLFDRINFDLTERQAHRPLRWVDLLLESEHVVAEAMKRFGVVASTADVSLAYGLNRVALEAFAARYRGRSTAKFPIFACRLLDAFGSQAARSNGGDPAQSREESR